MSTTHSSSPWPIQPQANPASGQGLQHCQPQACRTELALLGAAITVGAAAAAPAGCQGALPTVVDGHRPWAQAEAEVINVCPNGGQEFTVDTI